MISHLHKSVRFHFNGYAYEILSICCVYTIHILTKIFWYTNYNILICHAYVVYILYIFWLKYFDIPIKIFWYAVYMLRLYYRYTDKFVLPGTWLSPRSWYYAPEAATLGTILLLSTCTVAAIPCCSFFHRNWLSGLQITMLWSWMCLQDLTRQDPGVLPHSIEFCRPASCLTRAESTFTPSSQ